MIMSYPVTLKSYRGGQVGVFFADVPEAITAGTNEVEALDRAQDALTRGGNTTIGWPRLALLGTGNGRIAATCRAQAGDS